MDVFNLFATNETLEIEGREVPFDDKVSFKIARAGNTHFNRIFSRLYSKNRVILEGKGKAAEQKSDEIMAEVMAKTILLGWTGPVMFKGDKLDYSQENAEKLLKVKDFRRWISAQSEDFEAFKAVAESADEKN